MTVKYKVSDFAKDLNLSAKKVLDELAAMGSTGKKNSSNLEENELNYLLEKFSKDSSVTDLNEFLNSAKAPKEEPKPAEKKAEKKTESSSPIHTNASGSLLWKVVSTTQNEWNLMQRALAFIWKTPVFCP